LAVVSATTGSHLIEVVERSYRSVDPYEWDGFARLCGASLMSAKAVVGIARLTSRVLIFDFYCTESKVPRRIAQCALVVDRRRVKFIDRLMLLPEYGHYWSRCMAALIDRFGEREYHYGSHWNEEQPRAFDSSCDIAQTSADQFQVDSIEFGQWESFDHYRQSISTNIRRDVAKALKTGDAKTEFRRGWAAMRDIPTLVAARRHVMKKNRKPFSSFGDVLVHVGKILAFGKRAIIVTSALNSKRYAALFCIEFGDCLYYISGGVLPNEFGVGSLAMLKTLEYWYGIHPRGRFVMGYTPEVTRPEDYKGGVLLYRRKLRVSAQLGLEFTFNVKRDNASRKAGG
jgi:hypothetical protein